MDLNDFDFSGQPVSNIFWVSATDLFANDYNPNHVSPNEFALIKQSLLEDGWVLPLVCLRSGEIVDGFHRWTLVQNDKEILSLTNGFVPVAYLDNHDRDDRIFSTIRYNRARGQHYVKQMAVIINELKNELNISNDDICTRMGMEIEEVNRLLVYGNMLERGSRDEFNKGWVPG